ncbi:MAG: 3-octaprenyl-4-hydroxybenzoate carboxy-lyase [Sphingobacteriia bacterium 24-36-13]|jgi:4-hydroxy-3-polyprenylbenzoate decarboxylase|uniref:UbiD family decarboxylase n=1 Tax=Sediminibacterium sp. TaxID=1917865 RepID=UPI000BD31987|nr:UbiD family decarboxylase [Sediminibacterium sp.]OYY09059.1 MAG: 3-octaprenyl-4-hydroxybenzoate carboxy-lyase [Sphingobacteriia bacterium 35-36-14]OYZ55571.1 MAG: 3-octaprenyl-4-hydroxybenzoate carboxy-lyase [Sphingobacteriia bacterium 24-36-13]HQS23463.1 UbiD family decarboxylase [Sediminibacterium sp.]HQS35642.1 UbiD family decarboxylase [Sediminibacterium sp.]
MNYPSLEACLIDLEKNGQLIRIKEEVDPYLEMAAIHLRVYEAKGPALLFENVKGSKFRAASNIFGTLERSKFIFRDTIASVQQLIELKNDPIKAIKSPLQNASAALAALKALPLKNPWSKPVMYEEIKISDLPLIQHWPMDGGAFVTLPQVYTEDIDQPGIMKSNLGMYRIQLNGNDYIKDKEIGLHYQLHRGIGVHQTKANAKGQPLKVSCFVGGPPSHTLSAVMPLPEGISEMTFAGVLGGRRFRYTYDDGYCISTDADFVITGEVYPGENKPEGPFGDHLGYYSLKHDFPLMKVHKVYAKKDAIWSFTVVGRPPQEDTSFGELIHEITGAAIPQEVPGLKEVHAVDAAGVHPLLLAVGSERYTPYTPTKQPAELLTIANHVLGTGQLSLAKFLFIAADDTNQLRAHHVFDFMKYVLERINLQRDIHFYTNTTIDTLDYSGTGLNTGSKVVLAAYGEPIRTLATEVPTVLNDLTSFEQAKVVMPGVVAIKTKPFTNYETVKEEMKMLNYQLHDSVEQLKGVAILVVCDDSAFVAANMRNYLWVTYTRCNPSHDMHGIKESFVNKHWGCEGPLVIDARIKPHHAPPVEKDPSVEKRIDRIFAKGGSLQNIA